MEQSEFKGKAITANRCAELHDLIRTLPRYRFPVSQNGLPANGVYFMFEIGEHGHGGDRIVRIGSHTGIDNLAARLQEHVSFNKDRSIFRKHIGRALLSRAKDPYLKIWELDSTSSADKNKNKHRVDLSRQQEIEALVSEVIAETFSVAVLPACDPVEACRIEKASIGTVAGCPDCAASKSWLGLHSTNSKINQGGLWQVQHLRNNGLSSGDILAIKASCRARV